MQRLKAWFTDFWPEWADEDFISPILRRHFELVLDPEAPDVLFHSLFGGMKGAAGYRCKKVLFVGENYPASAFASDFSIGFEPHGPTHYRLPLWQAFLLRRPKLAKILMGARPAPASFTRFCAFVVSNGANPVRKAFFQRLSEASPGRVHSYGRHLTNDMALQALSAGRYWRDAKIAFFARNPHKYAIAFENNAAPYYATEKLMDAFLGGSVPIYWGDPLIDRDWNPAAFLDAGKLGFEATIAAIEAMEADETLFRAMHRAPVFTEAQSRRHFANMARFESWLLKVARA